MADDRQPIILNVDDYAPTLYARSRTLRRAGFDVREASSGEQALEMVHALHPDVVILDVHLPDISGIAVCKKIKEDPSTARVIVLQTSATAIAAVDRARALEGGADSYLIEPAEPEELVATVRALLRLGRAEMARDESERIWRSMLAATNDAVLLVDPRLIIRAANDKAAALYGYTLSELHGMPLRRLRSPTALESFEAQLDQAWQKDGSVYETEHIRKDGRVFPVEVSSKPLGEGDSVRYVHAVRDISERRRNEENLRFLSEASKLLSSSLNIEATLASVTRLAVPRIADWCAIDLLTPEGEIQLVEVAHANPDKVKWARELRARMPVDPASPRGLPHVIRSGEPEFYPEITDALLKEIALTQEQLEVAREVGFSAAMVVPLVGHDRTLGAITLVSAETGHRFLPSEYEMALELGRRAGMAIENARLYQESQAAIRTRDIFVSVASHELKTPVTVIQGYAELLKRLVDNLPAEGKGDAAGQPRINERVLGERINRIYNASMRLTRLLSDLLDINRIQRGALDLQLEEVELRKLVSDIVQTSVQEERALSGTTGFLPIEFHADCGEVIGTWDPNRIEMVVVNLLDNAVKYSPNGGSVEVTLTAEPLTGAEGYWAHLTVRDHGIGIPQEDQPRLFQPFMRAGNATSANLPGTGLGLAITREIVERHGGRIWAESGPGGTGTAFHVLLPATRVC